MRIAENAAIPLLQVPVDTTGAAINSGTVNMESVKDLDLIIVTGAIASGATVQAVTLNQSTNSSKAGAKALAFDHYYLGSTSVDSLVKTTVVSNTFNLTASSTHIIPIDASALDRANSFTHVNVLISTPGAHASLIAIFAVASMQRYNKITALD
jgi:hypothetical protein